jgi:hypothetical protein
MKNLLVSIYVRLTRINPYIGVEESNRLILNASIAVAAAKEVSDVHV